MMSVGFLLLIEDCHNRCVFCDASRLGTGKLLTRQQALAQIEEFAENDVSEIIVSGGEPLHHPDLLEVIKAAKATAEFVSLYTTAAFSISDYEAYDLKSAGLDLAMISLFGPDGRTHDATARSIGALEQTMAGFVAMKEAGLRFCVNTPVTRANYQKLQQMIEIVHRAGAVSWQLSDIHPTTAVQGNINIHVGYSDLREYLTKAFEEGDRLGLPIMTQEYPLCVLGDQFARSQELRRAWYTMLITEAEFGSGEYEKIPPITARSRRFDIQCDDCSYKSYCRGVPDSYAARNGVDGFSPIHDQDANGVAREAATRWLMEDRFRNG